MKNLQPVIVIISFVAASLALGAVGALLLVIIPAWIWNAFINQGFIIPFAWWGSAASMTTAFIAAWMFRSLLEDLLR